MSSCFDGALLPSCQRYQSYCWAVWSGSAGQARTLGRSLTLPNLWDSACQPHCVSWEKGTPPFDKAKMTRNKGRYSLWLKWLDVGQLGNDRGCLNFSYSKHTLKDWLFWQLLPIWSALCKTKVGFQQPLNLSLFFYFWVAGEWIQDLVYVRQSLQYWITQPWL